MDPVTVERLYSKKLNRFCRLLSRDFGVREVKDSMPWESWMPRLREDTDRVITAYVAARYPGADQAKKVDTPAKLANAVRGDQRLMVLQHIVDRAALDSVMALGTVRGVFDFLWKRDDEDQEIDRLEREREMAMELPE